MGTGIFASNHHASTMQDGIVSYFAMENHFVFNAAHVNYMTPSYIFQSMMINSCALCTSHTEADDGRHHRTITIENKQYV